jgi:hypothetical protein
MKSLLLVTMLALVLTSCDSETKEVSGKFELPPELRDCVIYSMYSDGALQQDITVVRCPLSQTSTTYREGKHDKTVVVVEVDTTGLGEYTRLREKFGRRNP